jgi:hypothetical protein
MSTLDTGPASTAGISDVSKTGNNGNVVQSQNNVPQQALHVMPDTPSVTAYTQKTQDINSTQNNFTNATHATPQESSNAEHNSDPDALTRLLEHIESLKQSNAEMSATLENIQEKNMENYHIEVEEKIKPWVSSLNIPPEQKESFLKGIQVACEQGMKKRGIVDFKNNPAFSIACAAAQAHGTLIENAEKIRLELLEANNKVERVKEEESKNYNSNRQRQHAILSSALTNDSRDKQPEPACGQKRNIESVYNTKPQDMPSENTSSCWDAVFSAMDSSNK